MPGFDRSRVVGKDEDELDEFICSICQDIFDEPVVPRCCQKSFCTVCIHQWLIDNNTCPNDRKRLTAKQLLPAPRNFRNLLNKLKIKCENYGNKCESVLTIEEMANHMKTCNICDSCKTSQMLLSDKQKEIKTLESENEKLKKVVELLQKDLRKLKTSNPISTKSEADAINLARRTSKPINEKFLRMTDEEINHLTNLAKSALMKRRSFATVSKFIIENFALEPGYKEFSWLIKTDFKDRISCHSSYKKLLRLTFNGVTIVFTGFKPD